MGSMKRRNILDQSGTRLIDLGRLLFLLLNLFRWIAGGILKLDRHFSQRRFLVTETRTYFAETKDEQDREDV